MFQLKIWFNENTPDEELNILKEMATHACKHWKGDLQDESTEKYIMQFTTPSFGIISVCNGMVGRNEELVNNCEKIWFIFLEDNTYEDALEVFKKMRKDGVYDKKYN